ncbi:MAG: hypothetical protein JO042_14200 [Sinobacteraceae bacterium]|nr:hypothetical protein [Nevskiaceae bacterium]
MSEINRYNHQQLQIVDPAIENLSVGGRFRYSDFDGVVEAMTRVLGIRARRDESNPDIMKLSGPQSGLREHQKRHKTAQQAAPQ